MDNTDDDGSGGAPAGANGVVKRDSPLAASLREVILQRRLPMFEKVSHIAEQAATSASRRQFLGRIGTGAMAAATAFAGLLVHVSPAQAGRGKVKGVFCCYYGDGVLCASKCPRLRWSKGRDKEKKHKTHLVRQTECSSCEDCLRGLCP